MLGKRKNNSEGDAYSIGSTQSNKAVKPNSTVDFYFFNVGQGECTLIRLRDGTDISWMLIDFGSKAGWTRKDDGYDQTVINQIKAFVPEKQIKYVILTHPDADHYNKLGYLIRDGFSFDNIYFSSSDGAPNPLKLYNEGGVNGVGRAGDKIFTKRIANYIHFVNINSVSNAQIGPNQPSNYIRTFDKRSGYENSIVNTAMTDKGYLMASSVSSNGTSNPSWEIFLMAGNVQPSSNDDSIVKNTCSIVTLFKLNGGQQHILLRGDATDFTDNFLLSKYGAFFDNNVITLGNVAHHGSGRHCNKQANITRMNPTTGIVSCKRQSTMYALPNMEVELGYLEKNFNENLPVIYVEGWAKDNEASTNINGTPQFYWEQVIADWISKGLRYVSRRQKGKKYYALVDIPEDFIMNVVIQVCENGDYYEIMKVHGDLESTYKAAPRMMNGGDAVYIKKTYPE